MKNILKCRLHELKISMAKFQTANTLEVYKEVQAYCNQLQAFHK